MANEGRNSWVAAAAIATLTNLHSLADGNIWQSAKQDQTNDPTDLILRIWGTLEMAATPTDGDYYTLRFANGNEHGSEVWPANLSETETEHSTAGKILDIQNMIPPVRTVVWNTGADATLSFEFDIINPNADWILLIEANGHALAAAGSLIHFRYVSPQLQ